MCTHRRMAPHARSWLALCLLSALAFTLTGPAQARSRADCDAAYHPQSGQPGKDVVWVPTSDGLVKRMLQMAGVTANDRVYDLGAGDGKIAIAAARDFGAHSVGVEYNPDMAKLAQCYVQADGLGDKVQIIHGDIFETDFSTATVVTLYLLPELNLRLRPTILKMKPGTRVVSHSFLMDDWEPDDRSMSEDGSAYLWIVPASVQGRWTFRQQGGPDQFGVELVQTFQQLTGSAGQPAQKLTVAKISGTDLELAFPQSGTVTQLSGKVRGNKIEAQVTRDGKTTRYVGSRT
jgi:SAM-dependent methyltransferase